MPILVESKNIKQGAHNDLKLWKLNYEIFNPKIFYPILVVAIRSQNKNDPLNES